MSTEKQAIAELKYIGRTFRGLFALADDIEKAGSYSELIAAKEARIAELEADEKRLAGVVSGCQEAEANLFAARDRFAALSKRLGEVTGELQVNEAKLADVTARHGKVSTELLASEARLRDVTAQFAGLREKIGR